MAAPPQPFADFLVQLLVLDRAYQGLQKHFTELGAALLRGGAARTQIDRYNGMSVLVYRAQEQVLDLLRSLQVEGVAPKPPFPPLFTTQAGSVNLSGLPEVVSKNHLIVYFQHPRTPDIASMTGGLGVAPIVWLGVGLGIGLLSGYFVSGSLENVITELEKQKTARLVADLQAKGYEKQVEQIRWRTLKLIEAAEKCSGNDQLKWPACLAGSISAVEATPLPANLSKQIQDLLAAQQKSKGLLWWIGGVVVVGGLAVGGVLFYQNRHKVRRLTS